MKTSLAVKAEATSRQEAQEADLAIFHAPSSILANCRATALRLLAALVLCLPAIAATNDLTTTLQRGLFEEEANQNLAAAIQAYQSVISQFDQNRKLAATAVFRLGEC